MTDVIKELKFDPSAFPIVGIVWRDHSVTVPTDGPWLPLKEALEMSGFVLVYEVGYLLKHTEHEIVIAGCLTDDEGTKSLSTILPECVVTMDVLRRGDIPNGD